MYPLKNWDNLKRGYRFGVKTFYNDFHIGLDLSVPIGTPIYAPSDGKVVYKGNGKQGGVAIHFMDIHGNTIRFLHLSKFILDRSKFKKGDIIAYTGNTGLSTGPHVHIDVSKDKLKLNDKNNFIDPEEYFKQPVSCLVIQNQEYDFKKLEQTYPFIDFDYIVADYDPKWKYEDEREENRLDLEDFILKDGWRASGYDMCLYVMDKQDYKRKGTNGYATSDHRYGIWFGFVENTGRRRKFYDSEFNGNNQVCGTAIHEVSHLLHFATNVKDMTHEKDKVGKLSTIKWRLDRFKGWKLPTQTRMFKRKKNRILTRIVSNSAFNLFKSKIKYWAVFGFYPYIPAKK